MASKSCLPRTSTRHSTRPPCPRHDAPRETRLGHGAVRALGTPRRLTLHIADVAAAQTDLDEVVVGPPESAAFKDGKPTKAAEAFAQKLGIPLDALQVVEREAAGGKKAGRYVVGRRVEKGKPARELLGPALADICAKIPFRKSMRWGANETSFGRPVQWIVALAGADVVDVQFAGVKSARKSRGHRFLSPAEFDVEHADSYVDALRTRHVLVDRAEREKTMMDRVAAAASAAGGTYDPERMLVDENASLVEEPHVVTGSFAAEYLALPAAVIRAVARGHQRYFCVEKSADELLPKYLTVVNTANSPANVQKGNDRVMRARLADASFFFEEDKKVKPDDRVEKLAGIVFHNRLGTVKDKVRRIEALARGVAQTVGVSEDLVGRAAHLCKFDLVSLMVGEFPELQGHMGRVYAKHAGEDARVADAIRDHYKPVGAADDVAKDDVAAIVALADRVDTLTGCFAVGLAPTGAADPFALRRACIAALKILLDRGFLPAWRDVTLLGLVAKAYGQFIGTKLDLDAAETEKKIAAFATERLRGLLATGSSSAVADAVMADDAAAARALESPALALVRAQALQTVVDGKEAWLERAKVVAKRLSGISAAAKPVLHTAAEFTESKKDDAAIVALVTGLDVSTRSLSDVASVRDALAKTGPLATRLDEIFVSTLVNDPADPLTPKRLELLSHGAACMRKMADFSKLV